MTRSVNFACVFFCRVLLLGALPQCLAVGVWAQAISGVVKDKSGAVLPHVTVEAASPALIEKSRSTVTDSSGEYKLPGLSIGIYSVTFTLPGFAAVKREGIELTADFTAAVDAELSVGSVTQTVEISSATPAVDVVDVNAQTNLSLAQLDVAPVSRNILGFSALMVGGILPASAQDVGGSKGEASVRLAFHGSHALEQRLLLDGMPYNTLLGPSNRNFFANPDSTEEVAISNGSGGNAEFFAGGSEVNTIPKDGGNTLHGYFFTSDTWSALQGTNLTPALRARGATVSSGIRKIYDIGGSLGGAFIKDRLWFFTAYRTWGDSEHGATLQYNADPNSYTFVPNGVPVVQYNSYRDASLRLTWQATPKNKFSISTNNQNNCVCNSSSANLFGNTNPVLAEEASQGGHYEPNNLYQATWSNPVNSKLLFEAGVTVYQASWPFYSQKTSATNGISVTDTGLGLTYRAPTSVTTLQHSPQQNGRFAASYVTGSHQYKVGLFFEHGYYDVTTLYNSQAIDYTFVNGVPSAITEYASPLHTHSVVSPTLGLYAQDQWTIKQRLTLSYGLRWDHRGDYTPGQTVPAGVFVPLRTFGRVNCVPCWNDLDPRVAGAYDLFGNGKTSIKASIGRYVLGQTVALAQANDPSNTTVSSTTRKWTDSLLSKGNYTPQCVLTNPLANGDCGAAANSTFGTNVVTTKYDPNVLTGWQHSPYNWQLSAGIEQQVFSILSVRAMFFRTWYGNFTVTDNLDASPADYSPYCVPEPSNVALPGGGGRTICGLYDLNPAQVGQINNFVTFASKFGKQTEIYQGVDLVGQLRLAHGQIAGGINIGNSNGITSSQSDCFVVNSPQQLYQCDQPFPYQVQVKFQVSYNLWWGIEAAGSVQSLPGIPVTATWAAPNSLIAPSLGRNLSSSTSASVSLIQPESIFEGRINQVDMRLSKLFHIRERIAVKGIFDLANILNGSAIEIENTTYGSQWRTPTTILDPRMAKFGAEVNF
jgi:hypothetical protein